LTYRDQAEVAEQVRDRRTDGKLARFLLVF
jgi:hypothetical protein